MFATAADSNLKYQDPPHVDKILAELIASPTLGACKDIMDRYFPLWIQGGSKGFSTDYPHLTNNWNMVCEKARTTAKEVILVEELFLRSQANHQLVTAGAEILTHCGFCVRTTKEYFPCEVCGNALPQKQLYDVMKKNENLPLPQKWSKTCTGCK